LYRIVLCGHSDYQIRQIVHTIINNYLDTLSAVAPLYKGDV